MYQFVTGPLAWVSFGIFFFGMFYRIVSLVYLKRKKDKVVFNHFNLGCSFNSILHGLFPFGNRSMREKPVTPFVILAFQICLPITPIFLSAHNIILKERWGLSYWTLSDAATDVLTVTMIVCGVFLILRRIRLHDVRIITTAYDCLLLLIALAPFVTGFIAYHQFSDYRFWLIVHIICGELLLIAVPFTRLSHMLLFFLTKDHLVASEMGKRRGVLTR